jgi:hypothetical protein
MAYEYNPLIGLGLDKTGGGGGGGGTPGGSDTQVQFNDDGAFGGSADLTWDDTGKVLEVGGDINLDDGGANTLTLQTVTPTAARTISFPDATGTVGLVAGSTSQFVYNNAGAYAGVSTMTFDGTSVTLAGRLINSYTSLASSPAKVFTGTWFTGGTATTTKPHFLIEPAGATSTAWSTSGTGLGVNAASGFTGRLLDLQLNGTSNFNVDSTGRVSFPLGAVGTPSLYPGADTNTGFWSPAADTLAASTNSTERARIDSSGRLLVGTSTNIDNSIVQNATTDGANIGVIRYSSNVSAPFISLKKSRGASIGTNTIVQSGDQLGVVEFAGANGTGFNAAARISGEVDGTPGASNDMPGRLVFSTTADGASSPTERLRITNAGVLQVADAGNISVGTTTGTKIGTATTQKLGFYNATPVVQPTAVADITTVATAGTLPTADGSVTVADADAPTNAELLEYCVELEAKLEAALAHLRTLGLIAT